MADGFDEGFGGGVCEGFKIFTDESGKDFGIGLGDEGVTFFGEGLFEVEVIFDDAVVDEGELSAGVEVGMSVFAVDFAVGGPAGV